MPDSRPDTTHFGFREVPLDQKRALVHEVFTSVANRYDLMNDLMSLGIHRLWKRELVASTGIRPGQRVLDLAGGTGDVTRLLARRVGAGGCIVLSDINEHMLTLGRRRLEDEGIAGNVEYVLLDAEHLPFASHSFQAVTMAFGLRNLTDKAAALAEMHRVLVPGGKAHVLEFSQVRDESLRKLYDRYSFHVLPLLGRLVADDPDSYRYLAESIRRHPAQEELAGMLEAAGFAQVRFRDLTAGVVAIHSGLHA